MKVVQYNTPDYKKEIELLVSKEIPFIIKGLKKSLASDLEVTEVLKLYKHENSKELGWYTTKDYKEYCPDFLTSFFENKAYTYSKKPQRIFCHPKGHQSLLHYDGNSIHGFNQQIKGSKRWKIISPNSKVPMLPFMYVALINNDEVSSYIQKKGIEYYEFDLKENEILFLPRYWLHTVTSLDKINISFNWVFTPISATNSKLANREREVLKLRLMLPILNKAFFPTGIETYAGGSKEVINEYTKGLRATRLMLRLFKEISHYIFIPIHYCSLRRYEKILKSNNFNIVEQ